MENPEYFEPKTVRQACALLAKFENAKALAGGVSLVVLLKNKLIFPDQLINLKTIRGLDRIEETARRELRMGALCRHRDIENSPIIQKRFEILAQAASSIASVAIRNMGTIGGNVCHAEPSADFPPALIALGATLQIAGSKQSRTVPMTEFFTDYFESVLKPDEILTQIRIPPLPSSSGGSYLKLNKTTNSAAIVGVGAVIGLDGEGKCIYAGLGVAGAASTPLGIKDIAMFVGKAITSSMIDAVASAAAKQCEPVSDVHATAAYRREMVGVLTGRALTEALKKAKKRQDDLEA